jgi:hypothetical protein
VIIDLSPLVRYDQRDDWRHVEAVVSGWKVQMDSGAVFYGVADNSLWNHLDGPGKAALRRWQRDRMAQSVRFADPRILELAERHPQAVVLTTDQFRDHRREFPWLQGSDRFYAFTLSGREVKFHRMEMRHIPDYEISWRVQDAGLKPKGITTPDARRALLSEWACDNPDCVWNRSPVIDDDPVFRDGQVLCPDCDAPLRRLGEAKKTHELVILLSGNEVARTPIVDGGNVTFGRGGGEGRFDLRGLLDERSAGLVSRNHLSFSNSNGRLLAEDLGSKNGSQVVRPDGTSGTMPAGVLQVLAPHERISIAGGVLEFRLSGKRRVRGRYVADRSGHLNTIAHQDTNP